MSFKDYVLITEEDAKDLKPWEKVTYEDSTSEWANPIEANRHTLYDVMTEPLDNIDNLVSMLSDDLYGMFGSLIDALVKDNRRTIATACDLLETRFGKIYFDFPSRLSFCKDQKPGWLYAPGKTEDVTAQTEPE